MPPTLVELYQVETLVINAAAEILSAHFDEVHTPGTTDPSNRTMRGVRFALGEVTGRETVRGVAGQRVTEFGEYDGTLEIDIGIARERNQQVHGAEVLTISRELGLQVAHVRTLFLNHPPPFAGRLPYWQVIEIRPQETTYDLISDRDVDFVTLAWTLRLAIMPGQFPELV